MNNNSTLKYDVKRIIGKVICDNPVATIVVFAGIHGNENAGVIAAKYILEKLKKEKITFKGNIFFIYGNINALKKGVRFEDIDLNRIWDKERISKLKTRTNNHIAEDFEQASIYLQIKNIIENNNAPFYFLDLHTTSSHTMPFITISDSLNNRNYSSKFPVPIVLGIEEYLHGPLLTYMNEFGHIALGFEGGQHEDKRSIKNCEAFIWLSLVYTKCIDKKQLTDFFKHKQTLKRCKCGHSFFEINYQYTIEDNEVFKMNLGFDNLEKIKKYQKLAISNGLIIKAPKGGRIFMPLYQNLGNDGFFIVNKISLFWIKASLLARKLKTHHLLRVLPGIQSDINNNYTLIVDPKTAKYLAKEIFHLFGYRQQILKDDKLHFIKRDRRITKFE